MSFIGPRPLLVEYLPYYTKREKLRHTVRPGLTGLAQASGRNTVDWDTRFELDATYVENLSFLMDLKVIVMTIKTVLGHSEQVAEDTSKVEGNFAKIRQERLDRTGKLKEDE
jgi:undecaprenyl phosphate N,N'-diacetylbacillosamine 1-phosphate transferase